MNSTERDGVGRLLVAIFFSQLYVNQEFKISIIMKLGSYQDIVLLLSITLSSSLLLLANGI